MGRHQLQRGHEIHCVLLPLLLALLPLLLLLLLHVCRRLRLLRRQMLVSSKRCRLLARLPGA